MRFNVFRTYDESASLETSLEIDIPSSTVDEFSEFYGNFTDYLKQNDVLVGPVDLESATYLDQFKPRRLELTDEMEEAILDCKEEGLNSFKTTFHIFEKFGVEVTENAVKKVWKDVSKSRVTPPPQVEPREEAPVPF